MLQPLSPLMELRAALASEEKTPASIAREVVERANGNASRNTYLHIEPATLLRDAEKLTRTVADASRRPLLFSIPISLKDCFDMTDTVTTSGSGFYAKRLPVAAEDSAMAARLRSAGALITGKTHLHPLAYGITGQNPEYGDCVQPRDASLLTGGSSSGAAASVQEGSALAAIGTDTGGSVRVPAALCGLAGYRASQSIADAAGWWPETWQGAAHLAPSFDTPGVLLRDPRDLAPVVQAVFGIPPGNLPSALRIGCVADSFLQDSEPEVMQAYASWKLQLSAVGLNVDVFEPTDWADTQEIFAGIQAHEAAALHRGNYEHFEPAIRDRLTWGASLTKSAVDAFRARRKRFCESMQGLLQRFDLLMLPCAPVSRLRADADLTDARRIILRYTTPFSVAGLPSLSLPGEMIGAPFGTGVQIAAAAGADPLLLTLAGMIGESLVSGASKSQC